MKRLLVVVDMQRDFVDGVLGSAAAQKIVPAVSDLLTQERRLGAQIAYTQDTHGEDYLSTREGKYLPVPHCIKGTKGWEILPELLMPNAHIFEKNNFGSQELAAFAKGFDVITLCGVCTDICVVSNALLLRAVCDSAIIRVVSSACAGTSEQKHGEALSVLQSCQIEVE